VKLEKKIAITGAPVRVLLEKEQNDVLPFNASVHDAPKLTSI
jgi:hypothetical protein